ncbi:MAG: PIN domain-containing protein [Bryobacteraceae bacterium]
MPAVERFFVDTNVLLYSVDHSDPTKQAAANGWLTALWESGAGCISWQVLHEFTVNASRKLRTPSPKARSLVEAYATWQTIETSFGLMQRAWHWMDVAQFSYWDSLIVAAAERGGCTWLLTEDLQAGRKLEMVTIVNPFQRQPSCFDLPKNARKQ